MCEGERKRVSGGEGPVRVRVRERVRGGGSVCEGEEEGPWSV